MQKRQNVRKDCERFASLYTEVAAWNNSIYSYNLQTSRLCPSPIGVPAGSCGLLFPHAPSLSFFVRAAYSASRIFRPRQFSRVHQAPAACLLGSVNCSFSPSLLHLTMRSIPMEPENIHSLFFQVSDAEFILDDSIIQIQ